MPKSMIRSIAAAAALLMLTIAGAHAQVTDSMDPSYAYTYDFWGANQNSPSPYRVSAVLQSVDLKLNVPLSNPKGLYILGNELYLCDTGNNRIVQLVRSGDRYLLKRIINHVNGEATPSSFNHPEDVFVLESGEMFICDTDNNRVLKVDAELNVLQTFGKPNDATFDQNLSFLPIKVVADRTGRAFVLGKNVNKGLIKYERDGAFAGFVGASPARFNWYDYLWKMISTKQQRAQQESFVPTEYDNIFMDGKGFIYAVTSTFSEYDLIWDKAKPIRKLNAIGSDILIKNGNYPPIGDLDWGYASNISGPSKFVDITVLDNNVYIALDRTRGRMFGYDAQGRMLWAFGGVGNANGYFERAAAIEHIGEDLIVLDNEECSLTVFTPTPFGDLIYQATEQYMRGDYAGSAESWREVLQMNGNYDLAYTGIGRALLRQERYKEAMDCFRQVRDERNYSEAFRLYRKVWVEEHIIWLLGGLALVTATAMAIGIYRRMKAEVKSECMRLSER